MRIEIPPLAADDIECRIQSINESKAGKVGAILLLYKNARVDMRILDQVFGITGWQRSHEMIAGNLYCNIDIWDDEKSRWIRKQDVGTESNTEKEKGQASDAFKRAGFNIGIGRELYTAPFIYVPLEEGEYYRGKDGKWKCSPKTQFVVRHIEYNDRREITSIVICDNRGSVRFDLNKKHGNAEKPQQGDELSRYDMSEQEAPPPNAPSQKQSGGQQSSRAAEQQYADKNAKDALFAACGNDRSRYDALMREHGLLSDDGKYAKIPMSIYNAMYKEAFDVSGRLPWEE